jgi:hypothetical protein
MTTQTTNGNNTYLPPSPVVPMFLNISSVTRSNPMVVTVSTANQYVQGQIARFSIPFGYGMFQLNGLSGEVLSVDLTNLVMSIASNSTNFDTFVIPTSGVQPATMSPAGSHNLYNILEVPFHSEGNFGN